MPVTLIGDMNTPVSMLVIGITIASSDLRKLIRNSMLLVIIGVRMFLVPAGAVVFTTLLSIITLPVYTYFITAL